MQTLKLGNSDLHITRVGYGAWAIGGSGWQFAWGSQDDNESIAAIHRALELGVNWIDTAAVYGLGHSEEVVGRALKSWRGSRPYVFTKCGLRGDANGEVQKVLTADSIRGEVEDSLRRLSVDVIDLYQIHWPPDPDSPELEEGWSTLADLKREGKVRWIGVSNFDVQQLRRAQTIAPVTSLQPRYSLVHREIEDEILPYCLSEGIGVIVYSPMASGLLTGAMTRERAAKLPADDWRRAESRLYGTKSLSQSGAGRTLASDSQPPQPFCRRSCNCLDAGPSRRDRRHRRSPQCAAGRGSHACWRLAPHRR